MTTLSDFALVRRNRNINDSQLVLQALSALTSENTVNAEYDWALQESLFLSQNIGFATNETPDNELREVFSELLVDVGIVLRYSLLEGNPFEAHETILDAYRRLIRGLN